MSSSSRNSVGRTRENWFLILTRDGSSSQWSSTSPVGSGQVGGPFCQGLYSNYRNKQTLTTNSIVFRLLQIHNYTLSGWWYLSCWIFCKWNFCETPVITQKIFTTTPATTQLHKLSGWWFLDGWMTNLSCWTCWVNVQLIIMSTSSAYIVQTAL